MQAARMNAQGNVPIQNKQEHPFRQAFQFEASRPKLLNVAAWQLLNQLGSEILLRFSFVLGRRKAGFDCPDIWHSPIPVWQLPSKAIC
jgi:hypothetical protein